MGSMKDLNERIAKALEPIPKEWITGPDKIPGRPALSPLGVWRLEIGNHIEPQPFRRDGNAMIVLMAAVKKVKGWTIFIDNADDEYETDIWDPAGSPFDSLTRDHAETAPKAVQLAVAQALDLIPRKPIEKDDVIMGPESPQEVER